MRDAFSFRHDYTPYTYRLYNTGQPPGSFPVYDNGEVMISGVPVGYKSDTVFTGYNVPDNGLDCNKLGVEYTLSLATIKAIRTSVDISGAYMYIKRFNSNLQSAHPNKTVANKEYSYVGIYGGATTLSNGSIRERLNMTMRRVTHVSSLRMVITLTPEGVFIDKSRTLSEYNGNVTAYYYDDDDDDDDDNGNKITSQQVYADDTHLKYVNPLYYMDNKGVVRPFTPDMERDSQYAELILKNNFPNFFASDSYPFYELLNLRITKEIVQLASFSFYANNFLFVPQIR